MYQQKVACQLRNLRLQLDRSVEDLYRARRLNNLAHAQAIEDNIINLQKAIADLESKDFCLDTGRHSMPPPPPPPPPPSPQAEV